MTPPLPCHVAYVSCREVLTSDVHHAERSLVTVWSAPNYCYRCGNVASILCFDENLEREVKYFTETEENSTTMAPRSNVSYFL